MNDVKKFKPSGEIKTRLRSLYEQDNWHWAVGFAQDLIVIAVAILLRRRCKNSQLSPPLAH